MPDSTHYDAAEDGFHEIQLSGKQLVFLFMATTIVAVVIFLLGVQVGRSVRTDRAEPTDAAATAPAPAASTPSAAAAPAASGPPAAEPPAPPKESDEDLSYAKRLQSDAAPAERLKPERAAPAAAPAAPPVTKAAPPVAKADKPVEPPRTPAPAARPGTWVIQVHALKDRNAAAAIARGLASKGYPAFVLDPAPGSPAIYRVQVGRYNDRREAEQVAMRLKKQEQFNPWVQR